MFLDYSLQKNRVERDVAVDFLKHMKSILAAFGNPHNKLKNVIHVAGTNGKGSTASFLASTLRSSGYSVNVFTSPHLIKINERFNLNGVDISDEMLKSFDERVRSFVLENDISISHFEACTVLAMLIFEEHTADFNIFEVGLGGRFDATNVFDKKLLSIITSVSRDHTDILGKSLEEIAMSKIAIVEEGGVLFTCKQPGSVWSVFHTFKDYMNCAIYTESHDWSINIMGEKYHYRDFKIFMEDVKLSLPGDHQLQNAGLAIAVSFYLYSIGYHKINPDSIRHGLKNTVWRCRMETIDINLPNVRFIIDGSHNEDGFAVLYKELKKIKQSGVKISAVFGMLETKPVECVRQMFDVDLFSAVYLPKLDLPVLDKNYHNPEKILNIIKSAQQAPECVILPTFDKSTLDSILKDQMPRSVVVCFGSLYLAGKILEWYDE